VGEGRTEERAAEDERRDPDRGPAPEPIDDATGEPSPDEEPDRGAGQRDTEPPVADADVMLDRGNARRPGAEHRRVNQEDRADADASAPQRVAAMRQVARPRPRQTAPRPRRPAAPAHPRGRVRRRGRARAAAGPRAA